ncbi:hypothetical protein [Paenibacillus sp. SI8]|uniref:hypothetical protein n=1 Tax=unclassified Paenibacillus TaxID=185978 RepID=UPI0034657BFB
MGNSSNYNIDSFGASSGRKIKENGSTLNVADSIEQIISLLGGGSAPVQVALQNAATAVGNGTTFTATSGSNLTFTIRGSSTSRTINFELADPSGVYQACNAFGVLDPSKIATQSSGGSDTLPEIWSIYIPPGCSFRTRIGAVAGGDVTITGTVEV